MGRSVAILGTRGYPSYYGGFETLVRRLAPSLADDGWDVTVYGRADAIKDDDPTVDPRVKSKTSYGLDTRSISTLSFGLSSTIDVVRSKPDVALVMNVANGYWLPALRARSIPTVVNVDGIEWERDKWGRVAKSVFRGGAAMTGKYADHIVCDSIEIERRWQSQFRRSGIFIPYGGDAPEQLPLVKPFERRKYVLLVARFVPENSINEFIEAAERISASHVVVIVGSSGYGGEIEDRVRSLADRAHRVHWLGHLSDDRKLFSLWQNAGAYFHGHSVGGTNPALVQAMACGAPIVARDTVYNREVLGSSGVFTTPTSEDIFQTTTSLLKDAELMESLSCAAAARAASDYSWKDVCDRYAKALSEALQPVGRAKA
ncbi:glycosyltransferase [Rhodococcus sp. EPR-157]|uniref:glycosyltransferase n=1 Tax=Rhodococcus sp. EPR-157 TaxID=1813677 RepID=UPI0009ED1A05|nr:glycosyltransferase [Rhodococcus sp. EPR-157]